MRFGIVTPALNARTWFRACAASVRAAAQAAPSLAVTHYVRESDRSAPSVQEWAEAAGCVYRQGPDAGLYDAIGAGLRQAAADGAEILGWLNADEQYLPGALAAAERAFESNPRIGLVFGDYLILGADGSLLSARREIPARLLYLRNSVNYLFSCTVFFRRSVWESSAQFDPSYRLVADKQFYLGLLSSGVRAQLLPEYMAAFTSTGRNASLDPAAPAEWERLRAECGAAPSAGVRSAIRALRILEKTVHGYYFPDRIRTTLFAPDGTPKSVHALVGSRWRWS